MLFGKPFTGAFGPTKTMILTVKASEVAGALRAIVTVAPEYAERFFAIWVNEVLISYEWCDEDGEFTVALPPDYGGTVGSFYIQDIGRFPSFEPDDYAYLNWHAEVEGALTAQNLRFNWDANTVYTQSTIYGDTQLSSVTITGAERSINVEDVPNFPTRGRLRYSLITIGTTRYLRWWNGNTLVAEGSRTGDGAVTCSEVENSGITVTATITYTGAVDKNDAWIDLKWTKEYQIHYSTSSLTYPRTPQDTVQDNGSPSYAYAAYSLAPGSYNFNVIAVDDEGTEQSSITAPSDSPLVINTVPAAPTITTVTGTAGTGITVNWTVGESGCTYTLYYSLKNNPINFGELANPAAITTALNATSATTPAIADYTDTDIETNYNTLVSAWDSAISTANTAFDSGPMGFSTAMTTLSTALLAALDTFTTATGYVLYEIGQQITDNCDTVQQYADEVDADPLESTAEWKTQMGVYYGKLLQYLGIILDGNADSWNLPNGALAGSLLGGESTGASIDGALGESAGNSVNIYDIVQPFVKHPIFRFVVRATKGGIEEKNGNVYTLELNPSGGAIITARPNKAQIEAITIDGLDVTIKGGIFEDDAAAAASSLYFYVYSGSITLGSPNDTQTLGDGISGYKSVTSDPITVGGAGWYNVAVVAVSASGSYALEYDVQQIHIDTSAPSAVANLRGYVARSKGR